MQLCVRPLCDRLVQLCVRRLPSCVSDEHCDTHGDEPGSGASAVSTCLLTSLRLLLNVTHDNSQLSLIAVRCSY